MLSKKVVDEIMHEVALRLQKWIEWDAKRGFYQANLLERDLYEHVIYPRVLSTKSQLFNALREDPTNREVIELIDRIGRWEDLIEKILTDYYEICAEKKREKAEEHSILDGNYESDEFLQSNFISYLLRTGNFKKLTSPAIEYRGKILFMPTVYVEKKLGLKVANVEEIIEDILAEEELHRVLTEMFGEETSRKLDNIMEKIKSALTNCLV